MFPMRVEGTTEWRARGSARRPMPKQWVSRTFRTCVPGIQAAGLRRSPAVHAISSPVPCRTRTIDAQLILATVSSTVARHRSTAVDSPCPPDGRHEAEDAARCKSLSRAMASGKARGTPVREDGATRPPAPWRRRDSMTDARSVAVDVRNCGAIHRLRDMASEWPIQVRVTTANAGCLSTRNLNQNRRRPGVKAVPARTPTGSLASLPPGDHVR